jgi:hypothetical protein
MTQAKKKLPECSICRQPFSEFGNNPRPFPGGRCCDHCNWVHVIPARLLALRSLMKVNHTDEQAQD